MGCGLSKEPNGSHGRNGSGGKQGKRSKKSSSRSQSHRMGTLSDRDTPTDRCMDGRGGEGYAENEGAWLRQDHNQNEFTGFAY